MKSSITQIERRFDIPSSLIGVIDGSFEMGRHTVWSHQMSGDGKFFGLSLSYQYCPCKTGAERHRHAG